jgi:hypothetical protein
MKNTYKVVVSVKETNSFTGSDNVIDIDAYTPMDAHKKVQDEIDWRLQEISEIYIVPESTEDKLVYTLQDGFMED